LKILAEDQALSLTVRRERTSGRSTHARGYRLEHPGTKASGWTWPAASPMGSTGGGDRADSLLFVDGTAAGMVEANNLVMTLTVVESPSAT
jgi:hypothetical protein